MLSHIHIAGNYVGNQGLRMLVDGMIGNDRVIDIDLSNNQIEGI